VLSESYVLRNCSFPSKHTCRCRLSEVGLTISCSYRRGLGDAFDWSNVTSVTVTFCEGRNACPDVPIAIASPWQPVSARALMRSLVKQAVKTI
jgi:hypothetical protein